MRNWTDAMYRDEIPRDHRGRFRKGKPGGPGRPYGSLTKIKAPLGFLRDAVADWERRGEAALTQLRLTDLRDIFSSWSRSRQASFVSSGGEVASA
jgi:hypothetical protein